MISVPAYHKQLTVTTFLMSTTDQEEIRERIRRVMQEKDIRPADLAERMNEHHSSVTQMLAGGRPISGRSLYRFARSLGVTKGFLQTGVPNAKAPTHGEGEKLRELIDEADMDNKVFAKTIGINPTRLSYLLKQQKLPSGFAKSLLPYFPTMSTQVADLVAPVASKAATSPDTNAIAIPVPARKMIAVPFVPYGLRAGFVQEIPDEHYEETFIDVEEDETLARHGDSARVFEINGDSMEPLFYQGYRVLGYLVDPGDWEYLTPDTLVAVAYGDGLIVKRINRNALVGSGVLELSSVNPNWGTIEVNVDKIRSIWQLDRIIEGKLRGSNVKSRFVRGTR